MNSKYYIASIQSYTSLKKGNHIPKNFITSCLSIFKWIILNIQNNQLFMKLCNKTCKMILQKHQIIIKNIIFKIIDNYNNMNSHIC